jgi:hypothetical protein
VTAARLLIPTCSSRSRRSRLTWSLASQQQRLDLDEVGLSLPEIPEDVMDLDEALLKLAETDKTLTELVELLLF